MTITTVLQLIEQYGTLVLFAMAFLEALNCPGMPAGVILPAGGVVAASIGGIPKLIVVYFAMVLGSILGCIVLYYVGRLGGRASERWLNKHSGKMRDKLEHYLERMRGGSWVAVFGCRMVPIIRTLGSLLAGISRMPVRNYLLGTAAGVGLYNAIGIGLGYFAGWLFT